MNIERLKYFLMIVEKNSISKAAIALNMTQPPLSIAIKKFEKELGVQLFTRRSRKLELTNEGKLLYERGKELVFANELIIKELKDIKFGNSGTVTIGCSTVANLTIIPEVVKRLDKINANVTIKVLEGNTAFILEQLKLHQMDIGLVRNIFDKEDFYTTALFTEPIYVALPPFHPLAERGSIKLEEIAHEKFLMQYTSYGTGISDFILEHFQTIGMDPKIIYWGTETLPMLNMVNNHLGITFVPSIFTKVEGYTLPPLVKLENFTMRANLNLVTLRDAIHTSVTEVFLRTTKEVIDDISKDLSI